MSETPLPPDAPTPASTPAPALAAPMSDPARPPEGSAPVPPGGTREAAGAPLTPAACAQQLAERFPALFAGKPRPLKLRIQADIQARAPGVFTRQALSAFLRRHTGSTAYLNALVASGQRFDLDGEPAGELSDEHRQAAVDELARRRALHAQRREQEQQERRHRASLLRDFESTRLTPANFCALKGIAPEALDGLLAIAREEAAQRPPQEPARDRRGPRREPRHERSRPRR